MRNAAFLNHYAGPVNFSNQTTARSVRRSRKFIIGLMLVLALFAFEIFNFDTTRFALESFLGDVRFAGLGWAAILAVAFCAIDFAGLARLFTPERGFDEPKEVWYLTGAWLLGATMNAVMTWWAVSLTLLNHDLGNELVSREQLLTIVPIFVAALVWLTRILFIGALTVAGGQILHTSTGSKDQKSTNSRLQPLRMRPIESTRRVRDQMGAELSPIDISQPAAVSEPVNGSVAEPV